MAVESAIDIRQYIEERLKRAPVSSYEYPLAYTAWGVDEIMAALDCLCDQRTTMWEVTQAFEDEFAAYLGSSDAVMVNSGSSADLVMMLAAVESGLLKPGDEILIPAVTWPTQVWAAVQAGLSVKLMDVDAETLNTSPELLEAAISQKTKAIFLVHLMGNPCRMDQIQSLARRHGLLIFEDCCEALGAEFNTRKVGTFGKASAFSFFASHQITTMEGGMVATSDEDFADVCRSLRAHGWARDLKHAHIHYEIYGCDDPRYFFIGKGFNFRPTELSAAFGRIQLEKLPTMLHQREANVPDIEIKLTSAQSRPAWFAWPIILEARRDRHAIKSYLHDRGVDSRPIVGGNLLRHPAFYKYSNMSSLALPGADIIHNRGFYVGLPLDKDKVIGLGEILGEAVA